MGRAAHLIIVIVSCFLVYFCQAKGFFPDSRDFAKQSAITASSTCGETESKYCDPQTLRAVTCTKKSCKSACCTTCTDSSPTTHDLAAGRSRQIEISNGIPRPGTTQNSLGFDAQKGSYIVIGRLPTFEYKTEGFTICVWVNQTSGNEGTIFSKSPPTTSSVVYGIVLKDFAVTLYYLPEGSNLTESIKVSPLASQYPRDPEGWHFICVMVIDTELSYFLNGAYVGTDVSLKNSITDAPGRARVGQMFSGAQQYDGLMQDISFFSKVLTNREVTEVYTGTFPTTYIASECRCPPTHPKISTSLPGRKCAKNSDKPERLSDLVSRLAETAHPVEFATDGDTYSYWLSNDTQNVTIDVDLMYGPLQVSHIVSRFYGPEPAAILIERSVNYGESYQPWQYYAVDCQKSFGMVNNGRLSQPDSVNCLQLLSTEYDKAAVSFVVPGANGVPGSPSRPYGRGCNNLYCSPKLLDFIRATNVRMSFYNHTLSPAATYFGLYKLIVTGSCECYGNAKVARYIPKNGTNNASCVCECHPTTFTQGQKCERCQPLYNNKPFLRGDTVILNPCLKCECHEHASSCYYNQTLDPFPRDRARGGGGVCVSCQHHTAGQHCESCELGYYRETGKDLDDADVCSPCGCTGPGIKPGKQDCVKDNSDAAILAGQCECKDNVTGRLCTQCKAGYYDLKSSHSTGCITCNCDVRGTVNGDETCDFTSGQCRCKANVIGRQCDQCEAMFYNLTSSNSQGCQPCSCNMTGATSRVCDVASGQCACRNTVGGRQCERCDLGFHTLTTSGCQACRCSILGTRSGALTRCDPVSGSCQCKNYVSGYSCERCKQGYYNLQRLNDNGCSRCQCDTRGTLGNSRECHELTGICTCKRNVTGRFCDQCPTGFYNLSSTNLNGCEPCECHARGTTGGDTTRSEDLQCTSSGGQCLCLSNVRGLKCDQCDVGYVWNQAGAGCISCRCDPDGSVSRTCNDTGYCTCRTGSGVGGQFCDRCLPGYHSFTAGRCTSCNCDPAGITRDGCDIAGCFHCKQNVQGARCDQCKTGTQSLKQENPFGCSGVPSQQGPPIVHTLSSTTLRVTWDPPDQPNGLITSYELYRNTTRVYTGLLREFNDTGLRPYTLYEYYVITYTDGGNIRSFADGKLYRTAQDAPSGVSRPNITDIRPRSAKAAWSDPTTPNGILTSFFLESTNPRDARAIEHCRGLVLSGSCDVINLRPYTVYNFTVRVCTEAGCTKSQARSVVTRPTAPDSQPAPDVVPLPGGKSFSVSWDEPAEPNGVIFRYELHNDRRGLLYSSFPSANPGADNLRNTTITGLVPFSWYKFRVVTYTAQVSGDTASNWTSQRTAEAVPEGENEIDPQSRAVSSSEVNITWSLPSLPHGIIISSRVYIYTNETSYSTPVLARTVNRTSTAVVSELQPYTIYRFTVTSCNSVGCTKHSGETETRTLPSAPSGQPSPTGKPLNSTHVSLTWNPPEQPNGPVPPEYQVTRSHAAFYYPSINAIEGAHFPGLGYYLLSETAIPEGTDTRVEFWFRIGTRFEHGLIMFLTSDTQDDFMAVEIRHGLPWFIFDLGVGVVEISVQSSSKFNDELWHFVKISRSRQDGRITVDKKYEGRGQSRDGARYLDKNTGVYVGGVKPGLVLRRNILDSVYSLNQSINFIGCLRDLRLHNKLVSFENALEKVHVEPLSSGCPEEHARGVYLRGGGYLSLKKDVFEGKRIFTLSFDFRTFYTSGILMFVYGEGAGEESYLAVCLESGSIRVLHPNKYGNGTVIVASRRSVCDGRWHSVTLTNFAAAVFTLNIDGATQTARQIDGLDVSSELYFGGLPFGSSAAQKASNIGLATGTTFGGCIKNIETSRRVNLLTDVGSVMNVDLSGCPKNATVNGTTTGGCNNGTSELVYVGTEHNMVDGELTSFTDYLYRVESKQPGTKGGGESSWHVLRSGEGAPEFYHSPHDVIPQAGGQSTRVAWHPPPVYHGVLRGYIVRAYHVRNSSVHPVETTINEISVLNITLHGLEPFTWYDVRVAAFTNGGTGESPGTRVQTLESVPEGVLTPEVQRYPYSLFISWQVPTKPNGIITNYTLTVNNTEIYRGLNLTFNLTGLGVFTRHVIQLTACTKEGCTKGASNTVYTAEIPPQGVAPPDVRILGAHSAEVTWQEPGTVNGIIIGYQVLVNAIGSPSWETIVKNASAIDRPLKITIANLTAGTLFAFMLKAINGGGATLSSPTRRRTAESSPEDIPPPVIRGLTPYSILVTILEPGLPNGNITRYELYKVIGRDELVVFNGTTKRNYTETGLTPYSEHYFRSRVCTAKGCGSSAVGNGRTLEASPNGSVSLNITIVNSTSVLSEWSPVHTPNGVVYYNLVVRGEFFVEGTAKFETENDTRVVARAVHPTQQILFTQLLPYTSFEFQINASNTAGYVLSDIVEGKSGQGAPIGLAAPNVTVLNSTSAHVTWRPPARDNGVLLSYDVRRTDVEAGVTKIVNTSLALSLVMTDMEPYIKYRFQVGARTSGGKTWSDVTEERTLQDVPSPLDPPTISHRDSRSLRVNWDRATKPNGVIIHYILYRNNTNRTTVASDVTSLTVSGLEPFTIYVFRVAACTVIGCSNSSLSRPVRTLEDVPEGQSPPVLFQAPGPSVLIRWSVPTVTNGKISEYEIERKSELDQSNMSSVATVAANFTTEHVDSTVKPCIEYFYRVIAFTKAGGGTPSPWSNITTQEGAPEFVPRPTTRVLNSSAVHVTWARASSQCIVTHYIVRVLENRRNYSGFQADHPRDFIISGLLPYKVYNIVIAGCTASACRDSAPSVIRTHSGLPSNQPAPSARPLDSTSLRVTWDVPAIPGGVIVEFILHRRTLDEPLAENFTMTSYVRTYTGTAHSFNDRGLGIFSEQQYKVTIVNRHGNTTSQDSLPFRTGPAPPRAGVLLRGQTVNHTSVLLNWTLPEVKLLLGYVRSYEVRYKDIQKDIEYTFINNLPGSASYVVVSPLSPSKDYTFQVILNNGAGTKSSNEVTVRTLDGAPEGFNTPDARTINSTTIEVTWSPPRTPNGRITTYNVYANSVRVGSTSSLYLNITSLIPFTHYDILVEVCTVYACVRSASVSARTLPAVPEFLDSPILSPGRRNILVTWDPPRRPNGEIREYILYRRTRKTCPTRPPPVKLCTYIECLLAEQLCGTSCYNPRTQTCCKDVLYNKDLRKTCCDDQYLRKPSASDICCGGRFYAPSRNYQCCHGDYKLVQPGEVCCRDTRSGVHVGGGNACCGGTPYLNNTKYCVCGAVYDDPFRKCCGGKVVARAQKCCGGTESDGRAYNEDPGKKCCGSNYVPVPSLCCQSNTGTWKIYNYTSTAERRASGDMCCGNNRISAGLSCCNNRGFNASEQVCADEDSLGTSGCGNGTVCDVTSRNTALCNRCDFDRNALYCGYTQGYYTAVLPTPPSQDCDSFQQVVSGNATLRRHNDQGLEPFTDYEYYLVVYNTEGNVSSSYSINKTLMDAPEGLAAPEVTVLSARSINITFEPPSKPNGIISEYKLTRVDSNTTAKTLVYQGLDLSYLDTGVGPFTEYSYLLEVCTTLCSNISSRGKHYTRESTPEDVYPPMLNALSAYSIEVRWQAPGRPNGVITGYNISRVNNTEHVIRQWQGNNYILVDNSSDIRPYTNYTYIVTACTKIGCSSGLPGFVTTLEAPPEGVRAPVLLRLSARSIEVNWNEPAQPNGQIIRYALYRDNILIKIYNNSGVYSHIDRGLNPHTLYGYVIEASTSAGSTRSNESHTRTPQGSPEGIPPPTLIPQSSSSILVTWTAPSRPNGVITNYSVVQETVTEHAAGTGTRLSVSGLEHFTEYYFQVKACTLQGCGVGNRSYAKTLEAPPRGQPVPSLVALSDAVVKVTWRGPQVPNGVILSYEVERRLLASVPVVVFKTTPQNGRRWETLNSGLLPYRVYSYRIRVINSAGSDWSSWATVRTGEGAPSGIYPPAIHVVNATVVTASWQEPREANGNITLYELWTREIDNPGNKVLVASSSTPEQNVTVSGLRPSTNYEFQVAAKTVGGTGYSQWTLAETLEAPPLGLRPLTASKHILGRELTLSWDEPSQPNGVITDYVVYSEGVKVYSDVSRGFSLGRLQPFTSYTFQLEACTSAGCTKGSTQVITTAEIPPDLLQAPVFSAISSTNVTLKWQPPGLSNGIIILYQVFREDRQFAVYNSSDSNMTSYTDGPLQPYTKYGYRIRAKNSAGGTESQVATVTTRQAGPEFVHPPVVESVTSTYVNISWTPPEKPNGVVTSYTLRRNNSVINHWGYQVLKYVDHSVSPYTFYDYRLSVCTGGGCTHSGRTIVQSGESRPDAVRAPRLTVLSAIAIRAEWEPPVISNGIIRHYELYMDSKLQYNGSNMLYVTSDLRPYTVHTFHVRACTKPGCTAGPANEATTHEDYPKVLDKPTYTIFGPSILEIRWALPRQPNGVILYYTLRRNSTVIYNGSNLSHKDVNVEPFTYYSYVITAANSVGYVSSPVLHTERTLPGTPENVTKPRLTPLSGTQIRVIWSAPVKPNGIITEYLVLYNNIQVNVGSNVSFIAGELDFYTVYSFRIRACTSYPSSCADSSLASTRTLEGVPRGQSAPVIQDRTVEARSVNVTWRQPRSPNGVILRYIIHRTQNVGETATQVFSGLAFTFTDRNVLPYQKYEYRVTAVNGAGLVPSDWTTVTTRSAPPEEVSTPRILTVTQTSLVIAFDPPGRPNGIIENYTVWANNRSVSEGTHLERILKDLEPYQDYTLWVLVCTVAGCTPSQAISSKTDAGPPNKVEEPSFGEVTSNSIEVNWQPPVKPNGDIKRYFVLYKFVCSENCISKRDISDTVADVGLNTNYVITGLEPYSMYEIVIRILNEKYSNDSTPVRRRTGASDPKYVRLPSANTTGDIVVIDWRKSFKLNGPLYEYVLYENDFLIFRGTSSNSGQLPGRAEAEYIYVVSATTSVNGERRTVKTIPFNINNSGGVSGQSSEASETWYTTLWFLVLLCVLLVLAVFAVVALCLRRTSGDRTVFVRERDPLPVRPKSRSTAGSSNYTPSEAHFNLGMVDYNHDTGSRGSTYIGESEKTKYDFEDSRDYEFYEGNGSYAYNGKYDDDRTLTDNDEVDAFRSTKYQVFTDTPL